MTAKRRRRLLFKYSRRYSDYLKDHKRRVCNAEAMMSNHNVLGRQERCPVAPETNHTTQLTGELEFK